MFVKRSSLYKLCFISLWLRLVLREMQGAILASLFRITRTHVSKEQSGKNIKLFVWQKNVPIYIIISYCGFDIFAITNWSRLALIFYAICI